MIRTHGSILPSSFRNGHHRTLSATAILAALLACLSVLTGYSHAENYYLQSNNLVGSGWNTLDVWWSDSSGGGNHPAAMAGHHFHSNGFVVRTSPSVFGGNSLTNAVSGGTLLVQDSGRTLGTFNVTAQGNIAVNSGGASYALNITNLAATSTLNLRAPGSSGTLTLNISQLYGAGSLVIGGGSGGSTPAASSTVTLSISNADGFGGTISPTIGTLNFTNTPDLSFARLSLSGANSFGVRLSSNVTIGSVSGAGFANGFSSLPAGQYSAADLNTRTGSTIFSGTGMLTVPPPRTIFVTKSSERTVDSYGLNFVSGTYGNYVNSGGSQKIVTHNNYQYTTWYNKDRRVCVARRKLAPAGAWQVITFQDYYFSGEDTHNTAQLGICRGDGTIHLTWDHHVSNLHYRVSPVNAATTPDQVTWNAALFSNYTATLLAGTTEAEVTYPTFIDVPDGNLQLYMRTPGGPGDGDSHLYLYDSSLHKWSSKKMLISRLGDYEGSPNRSAYIFQPEYATVGGTSRLFLGWIWRETLDVSSNHCLYYASSDDKGLTWKNSAGSTVSTAGSTPLRVDTAGLCVWPIPSSYNVLNGGGSAVDSVGQYHVLFSHAPAPGEARAVFHYWRRNDGIWQKSQITGLSLNTSNQLEPIFGAHDELFIVYQAAGALRIASASKEANWTDWNLRYSDSSRSYQQPRVDEARWAAERVLSIFVQQVPATAGAPSPVYSMDFQVNS